ncbi:HD domain-containing phosphohydrolase [Sedimenticola hydrogenitrophicus]|uniref:HD domain-containing phosphohydrolase n=1 Tax=Sedimenticola hydrogenitrophicus TaxID=2967975 RepID=UPI0023AF9981|nr:HD domain-containing phosphohydrolase [Sedimenticola hydrogenitrophicus]
MAARVLFVDDEENILSAIKRQLRKQYVVATALSGTEALELIKGSEEFAVIVSDMRMPEMDGVEFLRQARELSPNSVRLMLTGNADQQTAIDAVNQGAVFRFMNKPCPLSLLVENVEAALQQYRLIKAEQELLEGTVNGSIKLLTDILSMVAPETFGKLTELRETAREIARAMRLMSTWDIEMAAMLSKIAYVTLPPQTLAKVRASKPLGPAEQLVIERLPETSSNLLANIPRLERVARIILYQRKNFDGSGFPKDTLGGDEIPLESRILKVLHELLVQEEKGIATSASLKQMGGHPGRYDPKVLQTVGWFFMAAEEEEKLLPPIHVAVGALTPGAVLINPVETVEGLTLITAGQKLTETMIQRLVNYHDVHRVKEPIKIAMPAET